MTTTKRKTALRERNTSAVSFAEGGGEFPGGKEIAYVLIGESINGVWHAKMRWPRRGTETSVRFDGKRVLDREETAGDVIGFYHTHPEGFTGPSARDDRTMDAWCFCFGKPVLCVIETCAGARGWIYEFEKKPRPVARVQRFKGAILVAVE